MSQLGIAVNYYWNTPSPEGERLVALTTQLALVLLRQSPVVGNVVLVDGSPRPGELIQELCAQAEARYLHAGRELSLPEGYNLGWESLSEPYIGLMQNDILPHPAETLDRLLEWAQRPDVGVAFPYLTDPADYTQHIELPNRAAHSCEPSNMQLNLNVFKRSVLEAVGGVDNGYRTAFYDPIFVIKIRQLGLRAVMVGGTKAIHVDQLTKKLGGSGLTYESWKRDAERWCREYAPYASPHDRLEHMNYGAWPLSTTLPMMAYWWLCYRCPSEWLRFKLWRLGMWAEPFFTTYPARFGARRPSFLSDPKPAPDGETAAPPRRLASPRPEE